MSIETSTIDNAGIIEQLGRRYDAGFVTDIESDALPPGLDEGIIRALSARKNEPEWMTQWRLAAYRQADAAQSYIRLFNRVLEARRRPS